MEASWASYSLLASFNLKVTRYYCHKRRHDSREGSEEFPKEKGNSRPAVVLGIHDRKEFPHKPES